MPERSCCRRRLATVQPLFQLADEIVLLGDGVVEERLAERRCAGDQPDGPNGDAGLIHAEQEEADAVVLGHVGIRPHKAEDPVGVVGAGGPDLLAIDHEVVALVLRPGTKGGEVRPGTGFRVALAPPDLSPGDAGQVTDLLVLGAVFEKGRPDHRGAHAGNRRADLQGAHLLEQRDELLLVEPRATVFLRPGRHGEAALGAAIDPQPLVVRHRHLGATAGHSARSATALRTVGVEPVPGLRFEMTWESPLPNPRPMLAQPSIRWGLLVLARWQWALEHLQSISLNDEAAMRAARKIARPLFMVSFHSNRASESATMPPPAWM